MVYVASQSNWSVERTVDPVAGSLSQTDDRLNCRSPQTLDPYARDISVQERID